MIFVIWKKNTLVIALTLLTLRITYFFLFGYTISSWFGISIILIFSGGIIIIFLYITRLSNIKSAKIKWSNAYDHPVFWGLWTYAGFRTVDFQVKGSSFAIPNDLVFLFSNEKLEVLIFLFFYIIISLVLVVLVSQAFMGHLKKTY